MKVLTVIFSLFILCISIVPCTDDCNSTDTSKLVEHKTSGDHTHNDDHDADTCSPLCTCNCCHTNILVLKSIALIPNDHKVFQFQPENVEKPQATPFLIWHPPKA